MSDFFGHFWEPMVSNFYLVMSDFLGSLKILKMRAFGRCFFGEMKFVLSNFLSNEDLIISYDTLINVFRFKA